MGEILQDSEQYILQWWDEFYDMWQDDKCSSLEEAKQNMARMKAFDKDKTKYRIIKETTKQEVIYDE
jgi:hypothetical protein